MENFFGLFFTHTLTYPPKSRRFYQWVETGKTQESVYPWRYGLSLVLSVPWQDTGRVIGIWRKKNDEIAFHEAAGIRFTDTPTSEVRGW